MAVRTKKTMAQTWTTETENLAFYGGFQALAANLPRTTSEFIFVRIFANFLALPGRFVTMSLQGVKKVVIVLPAPLTNIARAKFIFSVLV